MLAAVWLFAPRNRWVHRNWFRLDETLQNSVWTLVSGWCRHHWHHWHQRLFTQLLHYVAHITLCFQACCPQRAKGHLNVATIILQWALLGFEHILCFDVVWLWICCSLSQHHTRLYLQEVFHSELCWHWCACSVSLSGLIKVLQCFSTPYMMWGTRHVKE